MAHNFGDLDRVIDQWNMPDENLFKQRIYKLGHRLNPSYSPILVFSGLVNKEFLSVENHRHMSLRQPKCLRKSKDFLVPVGPFMDNFGKTLGESKELNLADKAEIIAAFFEGYNRQNKAFGYIRAFKGLINALPNGLETLDAEIPFDLVLEIKKSPFYENSLVDIEEFENVLKIKLEQFSPDGIEFKF
jgi:hypothetical protein